MPRLKRPKASNAARARALSSDAPTIIYRPIHDYVPNIVPASQLREWMEKTPARFAYRCLPLNIANAHGWAILNDRPFTATWNGETGLDAITIELEEGRSAPPSSHFGEGVLTFHIHGLFTTPPGWNLWVTGAPNHVKRGIQPLTGVIETDWSPYTFTMNWMFTEPNRPVRFEKDEPYCFFFPVERGAIERFEPQVRDFEGAEELALDFSYWSDRRTRFNEELNKPGSEAANEKWQKAYFRGNRPSGDPGPSNHQTKISAKPFINLRKD